MASPVAQLRQPCPRMHSPGPHQNKAVLMKDATPLPWPPRDWKEMFRGASGWQVPLVFFVRMEEGGFFSTLFLAGSCTVFPHSAICLHRAFWRADTFSYGAAARPAGPLCHCDLTVGSKLSGGFILMKIPPPPLSLWADVGASLFFPSDSFGDSRMLKSAN